MVGLEKKNRKTRGAFLTGEVSRKSKKRGGPACMQNPA
jgi:hypothetical protein